MFVIDDKQPKFLSKLTDAFAYRGVSKAPLARSWRRRGRYFGSRE